jgi:Uri superfamily endonuclease
MDKGIYCLVFRNQQCEVRVGTLGALPFAGGWHVYVGSAQGPGGLKRLDRHIRLAAEWDKRAKWHVDYLLTDPDFCLSYAVFAITSEKLECRLARKIGGTAIPAFGCSDCGCSSHLFSFLSDPREAILGAFAMLGISPTITTLISPSTESNI